MQLPRRRQLSSSHLVELLDELHAELRLDLRRGGRRSGESGERARGTSLSGTRASPAPRRAPHEQLESGSGARNPARAAGALQSRRQRSRQPSGAAHLLHQPALVYFRLRHGRCGVIAGKRLSTYRTTMSLRYGPRGAEAALNQVNGPKVTLLAQPQQCGLCTL